jgi:hypothetical protein
LNVPTGWVPLTVIAFTRESVGRTGAASADMTVPDKRLAAIAAATRLREAFGMGPLSLKLG